MNTNDKQNIEQQLIELGEAMREQPSLADAVLEQLAEPNDANLSGSWFQSIPYFGEMTMLQRVTFSSVTVALILVAAVWLISSSASVSLAQVSSKLKEVSSYAVDIEMKASHGGETKTMATAKMYWQAPGSVRYESKSAKDSPMKENSVMIFSTSKPGIRWNNIRKTYSTQPAKRGATSPLMLLHKLADYRGEASKELGEKTIDGRRCVGFEIALNELDASAGEGAVTLWVDSGESLPVEVTMKMASESLTMTFTNFRWNETFADDFFSPKPPADYKDTTPAPTHTKESVALITASLQTFADLSSGKYPQVKVIYGDVTRDAARKLAGFKGAPTPEEMRSKEYGKIMEATRGWARMNEIMATNSNAAYYGLKVAAKDKDRVLFRWKLDSGDYQVIYGDLHSESVTGARLAELEQGSQ